MFKLQTNPTFEAPISIPTVDGTGTITFVFKHKGKKAANEYFMSINTGENAKGDAEKLAEIIAGWKGVDAEYSTAALETLLDNYHGAAIAIFNGYIKALVEGVEKNSKQ